MSTFHRLVVFQIVSIQESCKAGLVTVSILYIRRPKVREAQLHIISGGTAGWRGQFYLGPLERGRRTQSGLFGCSVGRLRQEKAAGVVLKPQTTDEVLAGKQTQMCLEKKKKESG